MVTFPNAKINIGLQITGKRKDGYHNLQTVFYPVDLKDALEIIPTNINQPSEIKFTQTGLPIDGNPKDNICIKAYQILKRDFPNLPIIQMHLHKCIPMGAGLGGGSADGCYTLKMLNEKFKLGISDNKL